MPTAPTLPADPDTLYTALLERDPSYEGLFFVCVRTTGIFCRPTCRARKPNRDNVEFTNTAQQALLAGYRPCKVCKPLDPPADAPDWLADLTRRARQTPDTPIRDNDLRNMGLDPDTVRRQSRKHLGMTFHAYQRALRVGRALNGIRQGATTTSAALDAGYDSESGFRDAFHRLFGAPPTKADATDPLACDWIETPLGPMIAVASTKGLCLLEFIDRRSIQTQIKAVRESLDRPVLPIDHPILARTRNQLAEYFDGKRQRFDLPLDPQGTPFERAVWRQLLKIPHGHTRSYAHIATALGKPGAARAIGRANGANRIAIIIPCHRVIRADGALCGYGGGVHRKQWLLDHENESTPLFTHT